MEDPLAAPGRAIYARIATVPDYRAAGHDSGWAGLFTRPAELALKDDMSGNLPVRALNKACRMLSSRDMGDTDLPDNRDDRVSHTAYECGFADEQEFIHLFELATGWMPGDWMDRFCSV